MRETRYLDKQAKVGVLALRLSAHRFLHVFACNVNSLAGSDGDGEDISM